jgi:integrase
MAGEVLFKLLKPNTKKIYSIYLIYRYHDKKKLVYPTGLKTNKDGWNEVRELLHTSRAKPQIFDDNAYLKNLRGTAESIYSEYRFKREPLNNVIFRAELDRIVKNKRVIEVDKMTLFKFIPKMIEEKKSSRSRGTWKVYQTTFNHLTSFCKITRNELDFNDINVDFAHEFMEYLYDAPLELSTNYVSKLFENLCYFMHEAYEREYHTNLNYTKKVFKIPKEPTYSTYLNENEIEKILNFNLSDNKRLEKARDLFLVGCYTGLRYGDFSMLEPSHITYVEENNNRIQVIKKTTDKTIAPVSIPIVAELKSIIEKYNGGFPEKITIQRLNEYIKEVCQMIGFDEILVFPVNKGGVSTDQKFKKYELIRTHTARRSYATNMHLRNMSSIEIMRITGHKTETQFLKYIRTTNDENAINVAGKLGI